MKIDVKYIIKEVPMEKLIEAQKTDQVIEYCKNCNNYGKNHSCPDFDFNPKAYVKEYSKALVIMTVIDSNDIEPHLNQIKSLDYQSRVFDNYNKDNLREDEKWSSAFSMYVFNTIKDDMERRLLSMEKAFDNSLGLPPGSCTKCKTCLKQLGKKCVNEEELRYSLEALGFLVSDIYKSVFDMEMTWSNGDLPDAFSSISALLIKESVDLNLIESHLAGLELRI